MKQPWFGIGLLCLAVPPLMAQEAPPAASKQYKVAEVDTTGSVSPDGRFLSYTDWNTGDLAVRDLKTGEHHHLTNKDYPEFAFPSVISPNGQHVAYGWHNKDGSYDLRLIGFDDSEPRILYRNEEIVEIQPKDWSPDGKYILATFFNRDRTKNQIVLVSVAESSVRVLKTKTLQGQSELKMSFSPDGRHLAYDFPTQEGSPQRDIFVLAVDGSREVPLVEDPANDLLLGWTPDGKHVLFASHRTGMWGAWVVQVAEGKPQGFPELVKPNIGPITNGLGFTRDGAYYYGVSTWENNVYLTAFDSVTGKLQPPKKLLNRVGYDTSIQWSPDGHYLAYVSGRGRDLYSFVLRIYSAETGEERELPPLKMTRLGGHAFQPHWSPDGRSLLAQGRNHESRQGLYQIDAQTGEITSLVKQETVGFSGQLEWPVWARDGKVIFTRWSKKWPGRTIVARELETNTEKELYHAVAPLGVAHLAVSPDGQQVAFVWWNAKTRSTALKLVPTTGGEARELVKLPAAELSSYGQPLIELAWTPDSRHIIYATSTAGEPKFELWHIAAEGGEPQNLALKMEARVPYGLSVHPDGRRIAFTAGTPPRSELWVLENFLPAFEPTN